MPKTYYGIEMIESKKTNFATANRINKLSRAINKIDPALSQKVMSAEFRIEDVRPGINTIKYRKNGVSMEVRYDELENLSLSQQASMLKEFSVLRSELRQERAIQQLQEKGKISWQFKRSLKKDNPDLLDDILRVEKELQYVKPETIKREFEEIEISTGEGWLNDAEYYFQGDDGSDYLFDFYRPGESSGFEQLTAFNWNTYKVLRGMS